MVFFFIVCISELVLGEGLRKVLGFVCSLEGSLGVFGFGRWIRVGFRFRRCGVLFVLGLEFENFKVGGVRYS